MKYLERKNNHSCIYVFLLTLGAHFNTTLECARFFSVHEILQSIDKDPMNIPPEDSLQRVATLNGNGYIFYKISPLAQEFLAREAAPGKALLEIGSGFSNVPIEALKLGALYTANDLSLEHLKILVARLKIALSNYSLSIINNLTLMQAKAPYELAQVENA